MFESRKNSRFEFFALGFIAGMAAGTALALLTAPKSGRLLRRDLRRGLEDAGDSVRGQLEEKMRDVTEGLHEIEKALKDTARKVRR